MADLNKPESPAEVVKTTTPAAHVNGAVTTGAPTPESPPSPEETPPSRTMAGELVLSARWIGGLIAVMACGWGLIAGVCYLFILCGYEFRKGEDFSLPSGIASLLSLGLFLAIERKHSLSKFMGLRQFQNDPYGLKSALYLWVLGVPGMLFRSTEPTDTETEAEAQAGTRPSVSAADPQQTDGVREIIETVVFVVVLVLLLKSFAAEAFVIPTGSMAETLYGYQRIVKCPQCSREFPVNCSSEIEPQGGRTTKIASCTCPGCRYHINFEEEERKNPSYKEPDWNSGDRVLVAKFLYELFNKRPNRLDVVVFKYPGDSHSGNLFPNSGPMKNHTPMNYIKRLIGLPGETIAIHRGKLYVLPPGSGIEYNNWKEAQTNEEKRILLWQYDNMHVNDPDAIKLFEQEQFGIIRKPPETMLKMARLVYSNDNQAKDLIGVLPPRWAGDDWKEDGTGFKIDAGGDTRWLHYRHFLPDPNRNVKPMEPNKNPPKSLITDFMGYNAYEFSEPHRHLPGENWVGDLMVECEVTVDKNAGEIVLELSKSFNRFQLVWNLSTGDMDLNRIHFAADKDGKAQPVDKPEQLATKKATQPKQGSTYLLRFANFDDRLTVWLDSKMPFDDGVTYKGSKEQHAGPVKENDLEPASIGVKGAAVTVRKLDLFRDTYYTAGDSPTSSDSDRAGKRVDFADPDTWDLLKEGMPIKTLYVQPDHFLCLGDNSPESSDGRSWGLVPERLLLGRAMLVYYPFGRAGRIR